jgi:lysophospholipase L1-like esterase
MKQLLLTLLLTLPACAQPEATTRPATRPIVGLEAGWELAPQGAYSAAQARGQITIRATGESPTAGYEVKLVQSPLRIWPPQYMLARKPPEGVVAQVITPFDTSISFKSEQPITAVVVSDAGGKHEVKVEQIQPVTRVICLGDSTTWGAKIEDRHANSYPAQLQKLMGDKYEVQNFGINGATLLKKGNRPCWNERRFAAALESSPDVVVVALGTNDSKPENWQHKGEFAADLTELVKRFKDLPTHPMVWLCHPVPAFPGDHPIRGQVVKEEIIPLIDSVAKDQGVGVIDLHTPLAVKREFFPDTVHPNAEGARVMAETVYKSLPAARPR